MKSPFFVKIVARREMPRSVAARGGGVFAEASKASDGAKIS